MLSLGARRSYGQDGWYVLMYALNQCLQQDERVLAVSKWSENKKNRLILDDLEVFIWSISFLVFSNNAL